ncbi:hypothetical protein BZG36_01489 [Bifiguratus adelaidae]|uniref:NAD-dependent epimerase/dehydratase domain-containing protein n=1 Tax=Bifiguratus adelaidae TaxID=1938954 RepID=A0A261Y4S0_9FUNG|nr:hypothetical protein BZG36_01489 [Bifiguratus adelaidae]
MDLRDVFITGTTGYIGEEVANAFRKASHRVYGLCRNQAKASTLAKNEIIPVHGDLGQPEAWIDIAKKCPIVIHCGSDYSNYDVDTITTDAILNGLMSTSSSTPSLFVYTSGINVYKGSPHKPDHRIEEDTAELDEDGSAFLPARIRNEKKVLSVHERSNGKVHGVVLRPGYVYGRKTRHFVSHWANIHEGKAPQIRGIPDLIWSEIHIDDLVRAYLLVCTPSVRQNIVGQAFHLVDESRYTNRSIAETYARIAGYEGNIEVVDVSHIPVAKAGQKYLVCSTEKAKLLMGFECHRRLMLDDLQVLYDAWKARLN